jgi:DivIVA domain-containing protein
MNYMTQSPPDPPTPLDRLSFARTKLREGYEIGEVDDFLRLAHRAIESRDGSVTSTDVLSARFGPVRLREGYAMGEVDTELDRIAAALRMIELAPAARVPEVSEAPVERGSMIEHGRYLERCVELAREALSAGDDPFGSLLVSGEGKVLAEARNKENTDADPTAHPELELALWALKNLSLAQRASTTAYTSGEHCPMCAAAHGWVGLGPIVFAASSEQLSAWRASWSLAASPVAPISAAVVLPGTQVIGPTSPYDELMLPLHREAATR